MSNILILSAGRRVELVKLFKQTAQEMQIDAKIIAADISPLAPAIYFADKFYLIPRIGEEGYISSLIDICNQESIHLIVPTIDTELSILSDKKEQMENNTSAKVLISSKEVIQICRNKKNTSQFFEEHHFGHPKEYQIDDSDLKFPLFIKPLDGSSSINTFVIHNQKEFDFFKEYVKNPIIQEYVDGEEYTVDCFLDFDSHVISIVPRLRIQTRSGEVLKGKIVKDQEIIHDVKKLLDVLKPIGQITIQCKKSSRGIKFIEINPRFGGGAPMSIMAGANSCQYLYRLLQGEKLNYQENYQEGITFLRFDNSIAIDTNGNRII